MKNDSIFRKLMMRVLRHSRITTRLITIFLVVFLIVTYLINAMFWGWIFKAFTLGRGSHIAIYYAFNTPFTLLVTHVSYAIIIYYLVFKKPVFKWRNDPQTDDGNGAMIMERSTYGSARLMEVSEIPKHYTVASIEDIRENVLGQIIGAAPGKSIVGDMRSPDDGIIQRNNLILGAPGTGKSFGFVRDNLITSARRGESVVVTDPSGELYMSTASLFKTLGYNVRLLNINSYDYSDCWDCMDDCLNLVTKRLDTDMAKNFAHIFFDTVSDDKKKDFWYREEADFLNAFILYTAFKHEKYILEKMRVLFESVTDDEAFKKYAYHFDKNSLDSFTYLEELIINHAKKNYYELGTIKRIISNIYDDSNKYAPFNLDMVLYHARNFDLGDLSPLDEIDKEHPCQLAFRRILEQEDRNIAQQYTGMRDRLGIFDNPKLHCLMSYHGIQAKTLNRERTIVYVATSDEALHTSTKRPIASLFFSFALSNVQSVYDYYEQRKTIDGIENDCIPVNYIFDELYSIGTLGTMDAATGSYMLLPTMFTNGRKRKITLSLILQNYGQLKTLYGEAGRDTIQNACRNIIDIGVYDPESIEFLSKYSGTTTIMTESHSEQRTLFDDEKSNLGEAGRSLLTFERIRQLPKHHALVFTRDKDPVELLTVPYTDFPEYKKGLLKPTSFYQDIPSFTERKANGEFNIIPSQITYSKNIQPDENGIVQYPEDSVEYLTENLRPNPPKTEEVEKVEDHSEDELFVENVEFEEDFYEDLGFEEAVEDESDLEETQELPIVELENNEPLEETVEEPLEEEVIDKAKLYTERAKEEQEEEAEDLRDEFTQDKSGLDF